MQLKHFVSNCILCTQKTELSYVDAWRKKFTDKTRTQQTQKYWMIQKKRQIESRQSDMKISSFRFFIAAKEKKMKRISVHIDTHKIGG